jgi:O-antigen/teichoic acid export membrane protein/polysaccharide pyruvyl transferase WcaK-like protein
MLRQSLMYLPSRAIPGLLNFLGLLLYARLLGPADFGKLALIVGVANVVNASALYWVRSSYLRVSAEVRDDSALRATALGLNVAIIAGTSLMTALLTVFGAVPWWESGSVLLLVAAQNACEVRQEFLRAHEKVRAYGLVALVRAVTALGVSLLLLHFTALGTLAPVFGLVTGGLAGLLYAQSADQQPLRGAFSWPLLKTLSTFGLPLVPYFAVQAMLGNVDRFLLNHFLGVRAAGSYAAGYDAVQQSVGLLFISVSLAGLPLIFKAHAQGVAVWKAKATEYAGLMLTLTVFPAALLTLYHTQITGLLLGSAYVQASVSLPFVAWAAVIAGLRSNYVDLAFQIGKRTVLQLPAAGLALLLNTVLDVVLIPRLGILGAAIGSLSAQLAALALGLLLSRQVVFMPLPAGPALRVAAACVAMIVVACLGHTLPFTVSVFFAGLAYLVVAVPWLSLFRRLSLRRLSAGSAELPDKDAVLPSGDTAPMRVFIHGHYSKGNVGDEGLLAQLVEALSQTVNGPLEVMYSAESALIPSDQGRINFVHLPNSFLGLLGAAARADLVLFGGGSQFQDHGDWTRTRFLLKPLLLSRVARRVGGVGLSLGPVQTRPGRLLTRLTLRRMQLIQVRDTQSLELARELGVVATAGEDLMLGARPLPARPRCPGPNTSAISGAGAESVRRLAVSLVPFAATRGVTPDEQKQLLAKVRAAFTNLGNVVPFGLAFEPASDTGVLRQALPPSTQILEMSLIGTRQALADADAVLATRLHCLVFAFLQGRPTLVIAYHPKVLAMAQRLGYPDHAVLTPTLLLQSDLLAERLAELLVRPEHFLPTRTPEDMRALALSGVDQFLSEMLSDRAGHSSPRLASPELRVIEQSTPLQREPA